MSLCDICHEEPGDVWPEWVHKRWCPYNPKPRKDDPRITCPCGGFYVLREGKFGEFYGCTGFPNCKNTVPVERFVETRARHRIGMEAMKHKHACTRCGGAQRHESGMGGPYWRCVRCGHSEVDWSDAD